MNKYIEKIERFVLRGIRWMRYGKQLPAAHTVILTNDELNSCIKDGVSGGNPFMVCRFGSTEFENFSYVYAMSQPLWKRYVWYMKGWLPTIHQSPLLEETLMERLCTCSGFFPHDTQKLSEYTELILNDIPQIDLLGVWRQENIFEDMLTHVRTGAMEALEPYDYVHPWSSALAGKKVLVIHPFAKTIESQYQKREHLWANPDVLPEFELHTIKAVQTLAGERCEYKDWFEALNAMKNQMDQTDYDVAIIGCGAYGFHLAAHAKRKGMKAVHLGGATQILFGIKGKRWDENPAVSQYYNEYWVYPSAEETPKCAQNVENGCYW